MNPLDTTTSISLWMELLKEDVKPFNCEIYENNGMTVFPYYDEAGVLSPYPVFRLIGKFGDKWCHKIEAINIYDSWDQENFKAFVLSTAEKFQEEAQALLKGKTCESTIQ